MYEHQAYPSMRYHRTLAPVVVQDPAEDDALGAEWADTPAAFADAPDATDWPEAKTDGELIQDKADHDPSPVVAAPAKRKR